MAFRDKILAKGLSGQSDANIPFADLVSLLESFGFDHRQNGSHHIFTKKGIQHRINL
ncbi:MAG: type II toxin-antitoxin system HicA family toxin [Verrucomicrobiota bacterium]